MDGIGWGAYTFRLFAEIRLDRCSLLLPCVSLHSTGPKAQLIFFSYMPKISWKSSLEVPAVDKNDEASRWPSSLPSPELYAEGSCCRLNDSSRLYVGLLCTPRFGSKGCQRSSQSFGTKIISTFFFKFFLLPPFELIFLTCFHCDISQAVFDNQRAIFLTLHKTFWIPARYSRDSCRASQNYEKKKILGTHRLILTIRFGQPVTQMAYGMSRCDTGKNKWPGHQNVYRKAVFQIPTWERLLGSGAFFHFLGR